MSRNSFMENYKELLTEILFMILFFMHTKEKALKLVNGDWTKIESIFEIKGTFEIENENHFNDIADKDEFGYFDGFKRYKNLSYRLKKSVIFDQDMKELLK